MKNPTLVYQAKSFYNAYIALEQLNPPAGDELLLLVPRLVNGAFSAELTIKAILVEQGIPYGKEHNLKILFEKLPMDIQNQVWTYLAKKAPKYSDVVKRSDELLLMSEAFVQWRYFFEGMVAPSFDLQFLAAFANALIAIMFKLGYNVFTTEVQEKLSPEECAEIDRKYENNRTDCMKTNQEIIQGKLKKEQNRRGKI